MSIDLSKMPKEVRDVVEAYQRAGVFTGDLRDRLTALVAACQPPERYHRAWCDDSLQDDNSGRIYYFESTAERDRVLRLLNAADRGELVRKADVKDQLRAYSQTAADIVERMEPFK